MLSKVKSIAMAANPGAIDNFRLLVEKWIPIVRQVLLAKKSPMIWEIFARELDAYTARWGWDKAGKLLENYGARTDVLDVDERTSSQLLEDREWTIES
jgi:hypothetical protein